MLDNLLQLVVLFFVIFDPFASLMVFLAATSKMKDAAKHKIGRLAVIVAALLSFLVLIFGELLLKLFDTSLSDIRVAGGILLALLGIKMAHGEPLAEVHKTKKDSAIAIASLIGTPLLTGPATITTILVSLNDFGRLETGIAITIVLISVTFMFYYAAKIEKLIGRTAIKIISTVLGLITLAWGVKFIRVGLGI